MGAPQNLTLSKEADSDIDAILLWTEERFGVPQAETYLERIDAALQALTHDPFPTTSQVRDQDLGRSYRTHHLERRSRHVVVYRVEGEQVLIVRILHDSMDLAGHLPDEA